MNYGRSHWLKSATAQKFSIVVIGAGFGGLQAAKSLARSGKDVLLIDRNNYHTFVPLLYQVATAQIEPELIAYPVRTILRRRYGHFLMAEVEQIDFSERVIRTDRLDIQYNYLVVATGSQTQYLGVAGAAEFALPLRTLEEAVTLRDRIFACFEAASRLEPEHRQHLLTFAIVGGGATGVEIVGAFVELLRSRIRREYPSLNWREVKLSLLQASDRLLTELPAKLGLAAQKYLQKLGVDVRLETRVKQISDTEVYLSDGQKISTATVIWVAGLEAAIPDLSEELLKSSKGKLLVRPTLQSLTYPNVYAIGDAAYVEQANKPLSGVAPEALQQGVTVAQNITRQLRGQEPKPFRYFNKGRLAIIGCYSGVGLIGKWKVTGFLAWIMWLGVHLVYLPGLRNRLVVLLCWLQTYLLRDRPVRLIMSPRRLLATEVISKYLGRK
ncbi:NAD(P)/FAD-dependent oxidoreductase [Synechocystis sp. PCC 7509]|uniref:NAD(P)/FAD-dependent oxidoreductase n=1 Tax=Synechocystis sp. PCC 7509 TaxID=927677 RepID=UPI0002ABAF8C|nr:NAD(P)/FAD-dependent oxidoreductase [Synechocystis sp. PCC 7509]